MSGARWLCRMESSIIRDMSQMVCLQVGPSGGAKKVVEDSSNSNNKQKKILERLKESSFAPAAVAGALASFAGAAFGSQSKPAAGPRDSSLVQISLSETKTPAAPVQPRLAIEYRQASDFARIEIPPFAGRNRNWPGR